MGVLSLPYFPIDSQFPSSVNVSFVWKWAKLWWYLKVSLSQQKKHCSLLTQNPRLEPFSPRFHHLPGWEYYTGRLNWPILPERKPFQNQWLGKLRCGCPNTLLCCPNFSHQHVLCEPGSVTWDLVFDEKFCPEFECLNLTPQTQRLSIIAQKVSINLCRYCFTEGNDKIFILS